MVANPSDLVRGAAGRRTDRRRARRPRRSTRYRKAAPTGGGGTRSRPKAREASKMNAPWKPAGAAHARAVRRLCLRRDHRRGAAPDRRRARLVGRQGQQGRAAQRGPVAVGVGQPADPVRRPRRIGRSAQRHQRARRSVRAGHGRDRRRARSTTSACTATWSPAASRIICSSRSIPTCCARRSRQAQAMLNAPKLVEAGDRAAALLDRGDRHARRRRRVDDRDLARLAARRARRAARPRCSISTSISAPARWRSIWSRAAA